MAAMAEETTILIKQEEMDDIPNDPDSMGCTVVDIYQETALLIKKEEISEASDEPELLAPKDPLDIGETIIYVKQEHELKYHVDGFEHNALKDPLHIGEPSFHLKQEHEFKHDVDGAVNNVATSTGSESDSTRLSQHSSKSSYILCEETVKQEVVHGDLEIGAEESVSFTIFGIHTQKTEKDEEEKDSLFGIRLTCSLRENEFHEFCCSFCLQSFPSKYQLIMHVFIHIDGVQPPTYVCKSCGEVFCSNISLNRHVKMSAGVQAPFDGDNCEIGHIYKHETIVEGDQEVSFMEQTDKQSSNKESRRISRKFCNGNYNTHLMTSNAEKRDRHDDYGSSSIPGNVNHGAVIHTSKCDVCGMVFTKMEHLKRHGLIHAAILSHKCDTCGKSFTHLYKLKRHSLTHTGLKPHRCDICGRSFIQLGNLKMHSLIHTGSKPHRCDICGKSFTHSSTLKKHSLIHTGSKQHKCDICSKSFTLLQHLKVHSLIHTGSKQHKCDICSKSFTLLQYLKEHSLTHTGSKPHRCDICGKSFTRLHYLKKHSLIHIASGPHKCGICDKSFTDLSNLKTHLLIHTASKPHKCDT